MNVREGTLSNALADLARSAEVDLIFDEGLVRGLRIRATRARLTVEEALQRLLAGTGLQYRRSSDNVFIIVRAPRPAAPAPPTEEALPEILVIGRRAQNGDIRRTESDIQPYQVYTRQEIERARSATFDEFARTRLPANAQIASPAQLASEGGSTRSEINLRGLGANQTLILVDGRRLPNLPVVPYSYNQPDIQGIPIAMIDRVEVLTGTAGGIYGNGATAGAIDIVLRRDYNGAEAGIASGVSARGDSFYNRIDARIGFTPDHGRTKVMLAYSRTVSSDLVAGQRDYFEDARLLRNRNDPVDFLASHPVGNAINIYSTSQLVLDQALGGASLGSSLTSIPLGLAPDPAKHAALLLANAGSVSLEDAPGLDGRDANVVARPTIRSIFLNARHDFGGGVEAFADLMDMHNRGEAEYLGAQSTQYNLPANSPNNPFQQSIFLAVPLAGYGTTSQVITDTSRYTVGLIVPLPGKWRASAEFSGGRARVTQAENSTASGSDFFNAFYLGTPAPGKPALDPLSDWGQFEQALPLYKSPYSISGSQSDKLRDFSARLAGPLIDLPGGKATLTLLAEDRRETVDSSIEYLNLGGFELTLTEPRVAQQVRSLYAEARLPLTRSGGFLDRLELQLALRRDWTRQTLPVGVTFQESDPTPFTKFNDTTLYTAGARFFPVKEVMLRASIATGALPPTTGQLGSRSDLKPVGVTDPRRGGRILGSEGPFTTVTGGRLDLEPERARSISIGVVLNPTGDKGPRISIDFTRIDKRNEIVAFPDTTAASLLAQEALYPDRVTRAPLTAADTALGFTGGPVTNLDFTSINLGKTRIDSVDVALDQTFAVGAGPIAFYLRTTWEPTYRQQTRAGAPWIDRVGYSDGPLEWRGNAGAEWSKGPVSLGLNGQFYSHYKATNAVTDTDLNAQRLKYQGAAYIPAQFYMDLSAGYRFHKSGKFFLPSGADLRFGIINLLDHRPPTVADAGGPGYSFYGDPRRRRIEMSLTIPVD